MKVLAAVGLKREAEIAAGLGLEPVVGGGDTQALAEKLRARCVGAHGIVSFGLAAGLSPALHTGTMMIATSVVDADAPSRRFICHEGWQGHLLAAWPGARVGVMAGTSRVIASAEEKRAIAAQCGADCLDMESFATANVASHAGLPFAILRVIADEAGDDLPPAASVAMRADGGVALGAVLKSLVRHPAQLPSLIRLGRQSEKAFRELLRSHNLFGGRLFVPADLG